jgi:hypothetical protein
MDKPNLLTMKNLIYVLSFLPILAITSCNDDDDDCQGIDCLPPATQTGAGTFGCLVNGEPFVDNSGFFNCFYQLVDGEYYFGIQAENLVNGIDLVGLGSNGREITINNVISLNQNLPDNFYGGVSVTNLGGNIRTSNNGGSIMFTRFTTNPNIVSASFAFTIIDPNTGVVYEITEGRFDAQFTQ